MNSIKNIFMQFTYFFSRKLFDCIVVKNKMLCYAK